MVHLISTVVLNEQDEVTASAIASGWLCESIGSIDIAQVETTLKDGGVRVLFYARLENKQVSQIKDLEGFTYVREN